MALERGVRVAHDVRRPLVLGRVGVAGSDVFVLQRFELLLGAEFVGLDGLLVGDQGWIRRRVGLPFSFCFVVKRWFWDGRFDASFWLRLRCARL
jgi:hypothetical protein